MVELAALHHDLAVDPLREFAGFAMEQHWHTSDAVYQQVQGLIQIWCTAGTYDQMNLGRSCGGVVEADSTLMPTVTLTT